MTAWRRSPAAREEIARAGLPLTLVNGVSVDFHPLGKSQFIIVVSILILRTLR